MNKKIKAFLINSVLLVISLCVSVTIAEYSFRYYKTYIKPDPTEGMVISCRHTPNTHCTRYSVGDAMELQSQSEISFNNWAFRFSRDYSAEKEPGEYRIAILGDSYTENLPSDFSWTEMFANAIENNESLKKAMGVKKITVANFANSGSGVISMAAQLDRIKKLYKPDMAIFAFIDEDFDRIGGSEETLEPVKTVEELVQARATPSWLLMPVAGAPGFEIERSGLGVSREIHYIGNDKNIINDKETLKKVHQAMIAARVHNGTFHLWDESKKLFSRWFETAPKTAGVDPITQAILSDPAAQEYASRDVYFPYFEKAITISRADVTNILFVNLPTHYEMLNQSERAREPRPFVYWPDFFKRRPDVPLISLRDYLPKASYEERVGWFVMPWDGHPSNAGATLYGNITADLVTKYLKGDHSVLVTSATLEKEANRYPPYIKHQKEAAEALQLLKAARAARKENQQEKQLELLSATIAKNDDVGAPGVIYQERADIWLQKGMPQKAYDDLTKALEKDTNPSFLEARIQVSVTLGNRAAMLQDLDTLEHLDKNDATIKQFVARIRAENHASLWHTSHGSQT